MHNNYSLAPEKLAISYEMLSDYCKKTADEYEIKVGDVKKLIQLRASLQKYSVAFVFRNETDKNSYSGKI